MASPKTDDGTRYVNKPGGLIIHLLDGTAEYRAYGHPIHPDECAEHQREFLDGFTDDEPNAETPDQQSEAVRVANANAARADSGQVNSTSSPIPGNYHDLSEEDVLALFRAAEQFPGIQAALYIHEKANLGRKKVLDGVRPEAKEAAEAQLKQVGDQLRAEHEVVSRGGDKKPENQDTRKGGQPTELHTQVPVGDPTTVEAPPVESPPQAPPPSSS